MTQMTLSQELQWRGFVNQSTFKNISELDAGNWTFYHGFDASSDSQAIGNLAAMMFDKVFLRHGHKAVVLAGGATSLLGDPGGKDAERPLQSEETIAHNVQCAEEQLKRIYKGHEFTLVNNLDWYKEMNLLSFMRDVGKHFSMTSLVQRDYIATRMGEGGAGISYTEFSYTLLQGYDFLHLHKEHGVNLQLAGADQWGNSISGVDLIRRVTGDETHIMTLPLVINKATGRKFGKSEEGAVWLDPRQTSIYKFYQFWLNSDDEGVEGYLKIFTELDKTAVDTIMEEFKADKPKRSAQKALAFEVTKIVHGETAALSARQATEVLFGAQLFENLTDNDIKVLQDELPTIKVTAETNLVDTLLKAGLASSKSEAVRFISSGAVYINGQKAIATTDNNPAIIRFKPGQNRLLLKRGKNTFVIIEQE